MKYHEHPNKWFMAKFDRYEPIIQDHTAMNLAKTCKRKYFYRIVLGFTPRKHKYQAIFDIGTAYHKFKEILRRTSDFQQALSAALKIPISISVVKKYSYLTRSALMQMCYLAYETWEKEKDLGKIKLIPHMIEQPLNVQLPDGTFVGGRLDAGVTWQGQIWDLDDKTSSKPPEMFIEQKAVDDQATRYIYMLTKLSLGEVGGIIYDGMFHSYRVKDEKLMLENKKVLTSRGKSALDEWEREQIHFNKELKLARDSDIWVKEEHNCGWCDYKDVCRREGEAAQMAYLETDFKKDPWDHTRTEQEDD